MDFKTCWIIFTVSTFISMGLNLTPLESLQNKYLAQINKMKATPQIRIDRIYKIVDSEYDDAAILQKIKQEKLY